MARMTLAQARAQLEGVTLRAEEAERKLEAVGKTHVPLDEYNRVQALLRITQIQLAAARRGTGRINSSIFEARREAAKELATKLGRAVTREEVLAHMEAHA